MPPRSRRPRRSLAPLAALLLAASGAGSALHGQPAVAAPGRAALVARLDSMAAAWVASGGAPGVSVGIVRGRDTLLLRGYGLADRASGRAVDAGTIFRIGSITKQFTAALVLQLVEGRQVALDDSIGAHLPGLPTAWRGATVRQLLNHTSGIPSYTDAGVAWQRRWAEAMPPDTILALTASRPMDFAPGTGWRYDNTGYVLLGMLVERRFGKPYAALVEERLARPLGLTRTHYCPQTLPTPGYATGYAPQGADFVPAPVLSMTQPYAAGALCSTPGDLARWNAALAGGRVVRPASYAAMTTPEGAAAAQRYGFGLGVGALQGHRMVTHGGGIHGFIGENVHFPDDSLTVTVLANAAPSQPGRLLQQLARVALGLPVPTAVVLTAAERAAYSGSYDVRFPGGTLVRTRIREAGDRLILRADAPGQGDVVLIPLGDHSFGADFDETLRVTFTLVGGRATALTVSQRGNRFGGPRVDEGPPPR